MNRNFDIKFKDVSSSKIYKEIGQLEEEWLCSLLMRSGISKVMIKKALKPDEISLNSWRQHLFEKAELIIVKDAPSKSVSVSKIDSETGEKIKIGEWSQPEIVRYKEDKSKVRLELKYWQII